MEQVIPLFSCKSLKKTLGFYTAIGFEVTYQQEKPYFYGAVKQGAVHIHFSKGKGGVTCLIHVPDVGVYHKSFADGLRTKYGTVPTADFPRITRLQQGQTRFYVFDPDGNALLFINIDEPDIDYSDYPTNLTPMEKALDNAAFLRDTYTDDKAAAKLLDKSLKQHSTASPIERARALAARAELAIALGDTAYAQTLQQELNQITLSDEERTRYQDELQAASKLEQWIAHPV